MKKIILSIVVLAGIIIALFVFLVFRNVDRNQIVYQSLVTESNITYKTVDGNSLQLDILMPTQSDYEYVPVVFYVHDGGFVDGDKSWLTKGIGEEVANRILSEGYAIVSMNYRLLDDNTHFPANLKDIKDSIRFINSVADDYFLDRDNFGIYGSGYGAYLALTAAYSSSGAFLGDSTLTSYSVDLNYVIDFYGMTNMNDMLDQMINNNLDAAQENMDIFYGTGFDVYNISQDNINTMELYDPLPYVSIDTVPTLIVHGLTDQIIPLSQSDLLDTKLNEFSIEHDYRKIVGGDNGLTNIKDTEVQNICDYVATFINSHYN
jgi:acetyl esterase/lipase